MAPQKHRSKWIVGLSLLRKQPGPLDATALFCQKLRHTETSKPHIWWLEWRAGRWKTLVQGQTMKILSKMPYITACLGDGWTMGRRSSRGFDITVHWKLFFVLQGITQFFHPFKYSSYLTTITSSEEQGFLGIGQSTHGSFHSCYSYQCPEYR